MLLVVLCFVGGSSLSLAAGLSKGWGSQLHPTWGGHLRTIGSAAFLDEEAVQRTIDRDPYYDGQMEARLKNQLQLGARWALSTHYELVALGGDSRENSLALAEQSVGLPEGLSSAQGVSDARRLFDFTGILAEEDRHLVYHRLDRLNLSYTPDWGTLRLGRQALTWGDGRVFNPMDLFNPFAPTAVQRDYKVGDDMVHLQMPLGRVAAELLYLPRRDPQSDDLCEDQASYALKLHAPVGTLEMDLMAARHYGDGVFGLGSSGYLGEALWRMNATYTHVAEAGGKASDDFLQVVANLDYAWLWAGRNIYGVLEVYYNELGYTRDYGEALSDHVLTTRQARGETFTLGRYYLACQLQAELHPLAQLHTTAILNLTDPSGLVQPQMLWDIRENWQVIFGGQWHWGTRGSEFGIYSVEGPNAGGDAGAPSLAPADTVYCWLTYYF